MSAVLRLPGNCMQTLFKTQPPRIKVGDQIPDAKLWRKNAAGVVESFSVRSELNGNKVVLVTVPGAFTPTCSNVHLPPYIAHATDFYKLGVNKIMIAATNNFDTMQAWAEKYSASSLTMIPDYPEKELAWNTGLGIFNDRLGFIFQRAALYIEDGTVKIIQVEEDAAKCTVSSAPRMVEALKDYQKV